MRHAPTARQSLPAFREKLRSKQQSEAQCHQAEAAIALYYEMVEVAPVKERPPPAEGGTSPGAAANSASPEAGAFSPASLTLPDPALTSSPTSSQLPPGKQTPLAPPARAPQPSPAPARHDRETPGRRAAQRQGVRPGAGRRPPARGGGSVGDGGQLGGGV